MVEKMVGIAADILKSPTSAWRAALLLLLGGHIAWSCGWIPGITGFALAQDLEDQEEQIEEQLARVEDQVERVEEKLSTVLRIALAQEVCRLFRLRNEATGALQSQLHNSMLEKQDEYVLATGTRYPVSECTQTVSE